jgi:hypothetical protein
MTARVSTRTRPRPAEPGLFDRLLDPIDRLSETIFSVLIVLTFTLAYRVLRLDAGQTPDYAGGLFVAALGAAFAWGVIDGIMYALLGLFERGEKHRMLRDLRLAQTEEEGIEVIAGELDHILEPITGEDRRRALYVDVLEHLADSAPRPVRLNRADLLGAVGSVIVAVVAVLPSLAPLLLLRHDPALAIRVSNLVSFAVLFVTGYRWGRYAGIDPWKTGASVAAVSGVMVLIAIPLGG